LVDVLRWRAHHESERTAFTFLADDLSAATHVTYAELDQWSRSIAVLLRELGAVGERALLLYPPGLDYVAALFGCFYAGATAVPVYPPRANRGLPRLRAIVADAQARFALTTVDVLSKLGAPYAGDPQLSALRWQATDTYPVAEADLWHPSTRLDALAALQYTSGSTGEPKGVMLTHANLLSNSAAIAEPFRFDARARGVSWLPPYHDMGLIGGLLQPVYAGFPAALMSPTSFLQSPMRWLRAISTLRATVSGGPDFAYALCTRMVTPSECATLDLSTWEVAFTGAEPIRAETLERFADTFRASGFRPEAFRACYGLAESTLFVTASPGSAGSPRAKYVSAAALERGQIAPAAGQERVRAVVGCGRTALDGRLLIVDPAACVECPPGQVGEIWVAGTSVAQGYWGRPLETESTFRASLSDGRGGAYLRTGDLGFCDEGQVFVTGRLKDLIIIRGRNHYPQDIEFTVERSNPALRPGCGAACSIEVEGEERLLVVQEVDRQHRDADPEHVIAAVRTAVARDHELQVYAVVLLRHGALPRTSSGKVQRHACRAAFLAGTLEAVASSVLFGPGAAPRPEQPDADAATIPLPGANDETRAALVESHLRRQVAALLRVAPDQVDVCRPLGALGLDSLMAVQLQHAAELQLGCRLPLERIFDSPSIRQLAACAVAENTPIAFTRPLSADGAPTRAVPLSAGQRALWYLHALAPDSAAYHISLALQLSGPLDRIGLGEALGTLVRRHAALRTVFEVVDGQPMQVVHEQVEIPVRVVDATGWTTGVLTERLAEEANTPFDVRRGPLLRAWLFTRASDQHVLLVCVHHLVVDRWSLLVLGRELGAIYNATRLGRRPGLAPPTLQYPDFVAWQQEYLAGPEGERLWSFWQHELAGAPPELDLQTDHPPPRVQTFAGANHTSTLPRALTLQLRELSKARSVTLYTTLLAAFQVLLHRYTGQDDVLVGSPSLGRTRAVFADVVGYFTNPLVLRARFDDVPPFAEFLGRVQRTVAAALQHQDFPFPLLVERLKPLRDAGRPPVFQVMFTYDRADQSIRNGEQPGRSVLPRLGDLRVAPFPLPQRTVQFDLVLRIEDVDGALSVTWEYNTDLFEAETVRRLAGAYLCVLGGIAADPERRISELQVVPPAERRRVLRAWAVGPRVPPPTVPAHRLLAEQAARSPDAVAVACGDDHLGYAALHARANQLAHHLRRLGVAPEQPVGVYLERSADLLVGLLGILAADAAYVPLDVAYPSDRLALMLHATDARVVLTQQRLRDRLPPTAARVVCLDADWPRIARLPTQPPPSTAGPDHLAYIIFTSGSTGRPKGVQLTHGGLVNFLAGMRALLPVGPTDAVVALTSLSFDIAGLELFLPLLVGGRVVLATREQAADGAALGELLRRSNASVLQATPTTWRLLLEAGMQPRPGLLALSGGEALPGELASRLLECGVRLWNLYGPTETTIWSAAGPVTAASGHGVVPLGRPIANTRLYVLDAGLRPAPVGALGELYIGGEGLARGYLDQPSLTAERFLPDPFGAPPGGRLYRTGDRVRYASDGALEFHGRADHQLKLRGYRIEPGEIEAVLRAHPAVRDAAVLARHDPPTDPHLVAYLVPDIDGIPAIEDVRQFMRRSLPDYMVPTDFVSLAAMPLTPNGKLDRRALPPPEATRPGLRIDFVAPHDAVEELLAGVWAEELGLERVGVLDSFFDLGGTSLIATRIVHRVQDLLGVEVNLRLLLEQPSVVGLGAALRESSPNAEHLQRTAELVLTVLDHADEQADMTLVASTSSEAVGTHT
jgi:amino acid adenylation domain-containing protein